MATSKVLVQTQYTRYARETGDYFMYTIDGIIYEPIILQCGLNHIVSAETGNVIDESTELYYIKNDSEAILLGTAAEVYRRTPWGDTNILDIDGKTIGSVYSMHLYVKAITAGGRKKTQCKKITRRKIAKRRKSRRPRRT